MQKRLPRAEEEWKACLTPEQYRVLREKWTEPPFTGKLLHNKEKGAYVCAGCWAKLFSSDTKYDSGSGWPSFWAAVDKNIELREDDTLGMRRVEIVCKRCGGHLGHLFDDGPPPTGKRYCINSASLEFVKTGQKNRPRQKQKTFS